MGIDYQLHRVSVDIAKGLRQFQKADADLYDENYDGVVLHLNKGLDKFAAAYDHALKAEDDAYSKAGDEIDKGNRELCKSIDDYAEGKYDSAASHYQKAVASYDAVLDLMA